tara:strand:- start:4 stop:477 length:474 start_codon:yes stop_codon:yes gene_type:complete
VYLAIGSNIGNRINNINRACHLLSNFCTIIRISKFYETNSWPNEKFPKYLNIIIKCNTGLKPLSLLKNLKNIESSLGRKTNKKNFPRTCDIDIIDFKGHKKNSKLINLPHPQMPNRNFVLFPLFEIEKNWKHPKNNIPIGKLLEKLDLKSLRSIKIY